VEFISAVLMFQVWIKLGLTATLKFVRRI